MNKKMTLNNWISMLLTALIASGLLATIIDVGTALASVSWNR